MTTPAVPQHSTQNEANNGAIVGAQNGNVIGTNIYIGSKFYRAPKGATADEKFQAGVRCLEAGAPLRARELISEAIFDGYETGEVRFYWVLAMLSKRSYRDLKPDERAELGDVSFRLPKYADDQWKKAVAAICSLLELLKAKLDPDPVLDELHALDPEQRDLIERYLDLVLTGSMKDSFWNKIHRQAELNQASNGRKDRAWVYFEPEPAGARARNPVPVAVTAGDWFRAGSAGIAGTAATCYLGWAVATTGRPLPIASVILLLVVGGLATRLGFGWRYRTDRLRLKDSQHVAISDQGSPAPRGGFADKVDRAFDEFFASPVPDGIELADWLAQTSGVRKTMRNEIVEIYRDSKVKADEVRWLIRYLVDEVRKTWAAGTQRDYRKAYRTPLWTKLLCALAVVVSAIAALSVVVVAVPVHPLIGLLSTIAAIWAGWAAVRCTFDIFSEKKRYSEDKKEYDRVLAERSEMHRLWKTLLDDRRPDEQEMEAWLYFDTMVLLGNTLRHYQLAWQNVVAHTFLQSPPKKCRRARGLYGPWRYSRYDIRLFIITDEGVREVCGELDFEEIHFDRELRRNYRFDAVSSVDVSRIGKYGRDLGLTLNNGPTRNIHVNAREAVLPVPDTDEDPEAFAKVNLDTTGFAHTLHILEGIAAEGKEWMKRDPYAPDAPEADRRTAGAR
jgi:hypothetical protein